MQKALNIGKTVGKAIVKLPKNILIDIPTTVGKKGKEGIITASEKAIKATSPYSQNTKSRIYIEEEFTIPNLNNNEVSNILYNLSTTINEYYKK